MKKSWLAAVILLSTLISACDRVDMWDKMNPLTVNPPSPITATVSLPGGAWLSGTTGSINSEIIVTFDASMDTTSLTLGGTMASQSGTTWSTVTLTNDTLLITPSTNRTNLNGATLSITCDSLEGASITINRTYNVTSSVYYVNATNTSGPWTGTRTQPMNVIQDAVDGAVSIGTPGVVLVAQGTYDNSSTSTTLVTMADGISLYGGYASDWSSRNPATYVTLLNDTRLSLAASTPPTDPIRIVNFTSISSPTVIDGFTMQIASLIAGSTEASACAIYLTDSMPEISNNVINSLDIDSGATGMTFHTIGICHYDGGGTADIHDNSIDLGTRGDSSNTCYNYAVYLSLNANDKVHDNNLIQGGKIASMAGSSYGIYVSNSSPAIYDNTSVEVEFGTTLSSAIRVASESGNTSAPEIYNNTISGGYSDSSYAIEVLADNTPSDSSPYIHDNIIDGGLGGANSTGIWVHTFSKGVIENNTIRVTNASVEAWGILIQASSFPKINGNTIANLKAPTVEGIQVSTQSLAFVSSNYINVGDNTTSYGIRINNEDTGTTDYTDIYNNVIDAGAGTTTTGIEIYSVNTRVRIVNNTINGGGGGNYATAINLRRASLPGSYNDIIIANNNIFSDNTSASSLGVREFDANSYPDSLTNNNFFKCDTLYYNYGATPDALNSDSEINATVLYSGVTPLDNIANDIYAYLDTANEYRLFASTDLTLTDFDSKGLDASGYGFTSDRDGVTRTGDWSMGAYEYDE